MKRRPPRRFSPGKGRRLAGEYVRGATLMALAKREGCGINAVRSAILAAGIPMRRAGAPKRPTGPRPAGVKERISEGQRKRWARMTPQERRRATAHLRARGS